MNSWCVISKTVNYQLDLKSKQTLLDSMLPTWPMRSRNLLPQFLSILKKGNLRNSIQTCTRIWTGCRWFNSPIARSTKEWPPSLCWRTCLESWQSLNLQQRITNQSATLHLSRNQRFRSPWSKSKLGSRQSKRQMLKMMSKVFAKVKETTSILDLLPQWSQILASRRRRREGHSQSFLMSMNRLRSSHQWLVTLSLRQRLLRKSSHSICPITRVLPLCSLLTSVSYHQTVKYQSVWQFTTTFVVNLMPHV